MKIDLSKPPEGAKWIAIDSNGEAVAYFSEPEKIHDHKGYYYAPKCNVLPELIGNVHD